MLELLVVWVPLLNLGEKGLDLDLDIVGKARRFRLNSSSGRQVGGVVLLRV